MGLILYFRFTHHLGRATISRIHGPPGYSVSANTNSQSLQSHRLHTLKDDVLSKASQSYRDHFHRLIEAEREASAKLFSQRASEGLEELVANGYCLTDLSSTYRGGDLLGRHIYDFAHKDRRRRLTKLRYHHFRDGAHVIASNGHSGSTDQDAYRGTVVKSERQLLRVAFRQYCNDLDTELCRLDVGYPSLIYDQMQEALDLATENINTEPSPDEITSIKGSSLGGGIISSFLSTRVINDPMLGISLLAPNPGRESGRPRAQWTQFNSDTFHIFGLPECRLFDTRVPGLEVSLFERLLTLRSVPLVTLDTQYRMHPSISQFVSTEFYDGLLQDGTVDRHGNPHLRFSAPISSYSERIGGLNILFLDHDSRETKRGGSWYNSPEATLVLQYVEDLLLQNPDLRGADIGIISPYKAQAHMLLSMFSDLQPNVPTVLHSERIAELRDVKIQTVDGFQGSEEDVIIFSTVRKHGRISEFIADERRLNVALTRAKRAFVLVGNSDFLSQRYGSRTALLRFIQFLHKKKCVLKIDNTSIEKMQPRGFSHVW
ncbi:hypothetical protein NLI96_g12309 [Meripilus lineatus]|uniref:DNA2/NAM7 helicase-like C-terminal domain-containing protein n=1 Tax=Meripilus lineatus TaxID=2056292 RepID=A0AAD5UQC3_9APHY|nr:hypothetical protein NLI96_g12309 [Physisporinus lineatus]